MNNHFDYNQKFDSFQSQTLYPKLAPHQKESIRSIAFNHHLSFQEFRQVVEAARDLRMWGEADLAGWWQRQSSKTSLQGNQLKKYLLQNLQSYLKGLKSRPKIYPEKRSAQTYAKRKIQRRHPRIRQENLGYVSGSVRGDCLLQPAHNRRGGKLRLWLQLLHHSKFLQ